MSEPLKICIQRAETRQEWNEMQDDYIQRALLSADRIETLEAALQELLSLGEWGLNDLARTVAREALEGKEGA
jgi:hypothetical protein